MILGFAKSMLHSHLRRFRTLGLLACCLAPVLRAQVPAFQPDSEVAAPTDLPDAPQPTIAVASLEAPVTPEAAPSTSFQFNAVHVPAFDPFAKAVDPENCPYEKGHDPRCHVHWGQLAISTSFYLAFQNTGNLYTGYFYREETLTGKWWDRYVNSVEGWRWTRWTDQNPFLDDYIGHPMQGAITNAIWIQNDPKGMTVVQGNNREYWDSRLRAFAFSTFFSFEWKLGPIGEASLGHNGDHYFYEKGELTNETGWVELVTTPVGGLIWTIGEDYLDRTLIPRLQHRTHNALALMGIALLTPTKTTANIFRFRAPWYRDGRVVKANSFFSDPPDDLESSPDAILVGNHEGDSIPPPTELAPVASVAVAHPPLAQNGPYIGGVHEFGVIWGLSLFSSGPAGEVKYMPIVVRYSYLMHLGQSFALRYSPEMTALSMISWPTPTTYSSDNQLPAEQRNRGYGAGLSPFGFQLDLLPSHRVQPFFSTNAGAIYYDQPVLGPDLEPVSTNGGSRLLATGDFGAGVNIFRKRRQALTLGYRHQYLAGSYHGASTQANTFYVGVSRFRTREGPDDRPPVF